MTTASAIRAGAVAIVRTLRGHGHEAFWAGGCVRDQLMGLEPKDYDIATSAKPDDVEQLFERTVPVGKQFGVVIVVMGGAEYEVATFRAEAGYTDGRRPDMVRWASAREDVLRRDFTINGLLYDPIADELADFVGGARDLEASIVRAIGDPEARFGEDRLRVLRAIRFAARFEFEIDAGTWTALCRHPSAIALVSAERIYAELDKILTQGGAATGLALLRDADLLVRVLPELHAVSEGAVDRSIDRFVDGDPEPSELAWVVALLDVAPSSAAALGERLRMSRALRLHIERGLEIAHALRRYDALDTASRKRLLRRPEADTALEAAGRAVETGQRDAGPFEAAVADAARWSSDELSPPPLLKGADLVAGGYRPAKWFGDVLFALETAQLAGEVGSVDAAWALVRELVAAGGD